jgi:hypothetical protein
MEIRCGQHRGRLLFVASVFKVSLVAAALGVAVRNGIGLHPAPLSAVIALLAVAIGVQNATARRIWRA